MAVKKAKEKGSEESIHVRIDNANEIRKKVLELAIETIELLKKCEAYNEEKKQKAELVKLLRNEVNEIKRLTKELNIAEMPLTMGEVEHLPIIRKEKYEELKKQREAMRLEELKKREERRRALEERKKLMEAEKVVKAAKTKPKSKLESDLEALKKKLAQL